MSLFRFAIERPVAVAAIVILLMVFGLVAMRATPVQLAPDTAAPVITVRTNWPGASPAEVEREIITRQEDMLRGVEGLTKLTSSSGNGSGSITLEFNINQNLDRALILVANRLNQVTSYPEEVDEPVLDTAGSDDQPIAWFVLKRLPGNERSIDTYRDLAVNVIRDRIERVPGVARVNVLGGGEREMQVVVDPVRLVRYGLTVPDVARALRAANVSLSAGDVEEGKRRYVVRLEGELNTPELVGAVLLRSIVDPATGGIARVTVADVAEVGFGIKKPGANIRRLGEPALAMNALRATGANVIEVMAGLRTALTDLNAEVLKREGLEIVQVYDETTYIDAAIDLVLENIWQGGGLAALTLLLFLRSARGTLIIALMMPVVVVGSFVALAVMGRSINVVLLAGLAFGVGLVIDSAIVVLENVYRLRQGGLSAARAAYEGTRQVWAAVWLSMLTTFVVFLPLLLLKLEVGQLFGDIAVAITATALLTLMLSALMIPALAARLFRSPESVAPAVPIKGVDAGARWCARRIVAVNRRIVASPVLAASVVATICGATVLASWLFLPKLEYLPEGNRNLVLAILQPPPGYNLETTTAIAKDLEAATRPLWVSEGAVDAPGQPPAIEHFFFAAFPNTTYTGAVAHDPDRVGELIPVLEHEVFREPGTFGFVRQPSIFGRAVSSARLVELNVSGPDLEANLAVARRAVQIIENELPRAQGTQLRPLPGLELGAPEVRLSPDPLLLADAGLTVRDFGETVDAFNDGLRVSEVTVDGERIDLMLTGPKSYLGQTQGVGNLPVVTASGRIVPVTSLSQIEVMSGPTEIRHLERERTVTLEIRPTAALALEEVIALLQTKVIDRIEVEGLPAGLHLGLSGVADKLVATWNAMKWQLLLAVLVAYLAMAIQFESFIFPLIVTLAVPLATAGGIGGLAVLNLFVAQPLDMLTLLGFVILIGSVGNNAILIVEQTLHYVREEGYQSDQAIVAAVRNRIRPIFMSSLTSIVGMVPLVVAPGSGSELYRGLGSVVVGGLSLSAVLTLFLIPAMLKLASPAIRPPQAPAQAIALAEKKAAE